jgi:hypothetical protein
VKKSEEFVSVYLIVIQSCSLPAFVFVAVTDNTRTVIGLDYYFLLLLTPSHNCSSPNHPTVCATHRHISLSSREENRRISRSSYSTPDTIFTHPRTHSHHLCPDLRRVLRTLNHSSTSRPDLSLSTISFNLLTPGLKLLHHTLSIASICAPTLDFQHIHPLQPTSTTRHNPHHTVQPTHPPPAKMVKWENDKNAYILGAALGASNITISNEIAEAIRAGWRKS